MNAIYNRVTSEKLDIRNTGLLVLSDVLALAMSDLAQTNQQRDLTIELLYGMDQSIVGTGGSYIDIRELPWGNDYNAQQEFLLAVIDKAHDKYRWVDLWYEPNTETTLPNLVEFKKLISNLKESDIAPVEYEPVASYKFCPEHHVLEHVYGCIICHNK